MFCQQTAASWSAAILPGYSRPAHRLYLMFGDPCIIAQFVKKIEQDTTVYQNLLFLILNEDQHVSGDTPPIIKSLKRHWQPLVLHTWKVVGRAAGGRFRAQCSRQRPPATRPTTFHV
jgi:hypothetical protein